MVILNSIKDKDYRARKLSIKEGIFASMKGEFGDSYVAPFAIAINASNAMISVLTAVVEFLGPINQMFGSKLIEKESRKKILLKTVLFEALMWLPLILIAFLFYKGIITNFLPLLVLLSFAVYTIFLNVGHPAWFSWMGDIVGEKHRGKWFSKRNLITGFISIVMAITAAVFLDYFKRHNMIMFGFMVLFFLAFLARIGSWGILKKQYEPEIKLKKGNPFSFWNFVKNSPKNNFGKFTIFRALIGFSSAIASPLIAVYLLRNLGFNYVEYIAISLGGTFVSLFALEFLGKFADKYGNIRTAILSSILIPVIPVLYLLHHSLIYLLLIPSVISGVAWAGLHLASGNFVYDNMAQEKRGQAVSYFNMVWGIGVALGAAIGAILIKYLNTTILAPIVVVFIISAVARALVVLWWAPRLKDMQKTQKVSTRKALRDIVFKHLRHTLIEETHQIMSIKRYMWGK